MKLTWIITATAGMLLALPPQSADVRFRAAQQTETIEGDLKAAIKMYERIVEDRSTSSDIAARSLIRIGMCHERLGSAEARKAYERVLSRFADQSEPAKEARMRLARLTPGQGGKDEISAHRLTRPLTTHQI